MTSPNSNVEIIHTKMHRPPVPHDFIVRVQLLDRLNNRLNRPLSLVSAPAGYGKSTLVSGWLERCDLPVAWLSLNESENDLHLFLSYFCSAVQTISPEIGKEIHALLNGQELPSSHNLAVRLTNALDKIDTPFVLTLDDYHFIQNNSVHELVSEIIKHPPHAMHLVLVSRIDPPLPLSSLRAKGQMTEIRVADLRFSRQEMVEFLQQMVEVKLDENIISMFEEKTEGWVTGLRLAALSLRHADDIQRVMAGLPDLNSYILDYFVEEILSQQTETMQNYLIMSSILDRFCEPLCDAVFGANIGADGDEINGQEFLHLLKKANLFIIRLDDEDKWFRYHHLFRNLLIYRFEQQSMPDDMRAIHIKASSWFEANGYFEEAIHHAMKGKDIEKAAKIVGHARHNLMNRDQWHRLARWTRFFSNDTVQQHPHLIVLRCWLELWHSYRLDLLMQDLETADALLACTNLDTGEVAVLKAEIAAMRCVFSYWLLKPSQGINLAEQAFRDSPVEHECTRSTVVFSWGPLYQMLGDAKKGEQILWSNITNERFKNPSSQARLIVSLGMALWPEAETQKLKQAASRLLQLSLEYELTWSHSFALYFLGLVHYERNELNEAVAQLEIVAGDPQRFPIQNVTHCSILLSLSYQALGQPDRARETAESIIKYTLERENQMFTDLAEAFLADLDLRQGRLPQANKWVSAFIVPAPHGMQRFFNAELTSIKVMIALNTHESLACAAQQLDSMDKLLGEIHHQRLMIDILGMQALLADTLGQESVAFEKLNEALDIAEPCILIRPFLDLGPSMAELLKRLTDQDSNQKYAEQILSAFKNEQVEEVVLNAFDGQIVDQFSVANQALDDPLTKREIEVLLSLTKRSTNLEIAEKLFISPQTVKRHLANIYKKLNVENRQQAVSKTKSLGII